MTNSAFQPKLGGNPLSSHRAGFGDIGCKEFNSAARQDSRRKEGFTLAEVLITLAIIGIVAVLTIPTLVTAYQERALSTASDVFQKRINVAFKEMVTLNEMSDYSSTEDFVLNGLSKYMKIIRTCSLDNLDKCFADKLEYGTEELELSDLTSADSFDKDEWLTTPYGAVFADGTSALILYDNNCGYIDPYNNQANVTACISMAYDVNGLKSPNTLNKDLYTINATLSKYACIAPGLKKATGVCVTQVVGNSMSTPTYELLYESDCEQVKEKYGLKYCYTYNGGISGYDGGDPYASLVAHCGGINKVTSADQLRKIAQYVYGTDNINADKSTYDLTVVQERWDEVFGGARVPNGGHYYFITKDEQPTREFDRTFGADGTQYNNMNRGFAQRAICVR